MKIHTYHKTIKAFLLHAAKKDTRLYLSGVLLETTEKGHVYIVATDGHTMIVHYIGQMDAEDYTVGQWIIPRAACEAAAKDKTTIVEIDTDRLCIGKTLFTPIDGKFPDWRRVIPSEGTLSEGYGGLHFDADLLVRCQDSVQLATGSSLFPVIRCNDSVGVYTAPDLLVLVMPVRRSAMPDPVSYFTL